MYRGVVQKAAEGQASPRAAIKAFCLYCTGYLRAEITNCTARQCPLWNYRPYQGIPQAAPGSEDSDPEAVIG
jgi:hypothetical protein